MKSIITILLALVLSIELSAQITEVTGNIFLGAPDCFGPQGSQTVTICGQSSPDNFVLALRQGDEGRMRGIYMDSPLATSSGRIFMNSNVFSIGRGSQGNDSIINLSVDGNVGLNETNPKSKLHIKNGDIYLEDINKGVIMKSPDGQCWRYTPDNSGQLNGTAISCP